MKTRFIRYLLIAIGLASLTGCVYEPYYHPYYYGYWPGYYTYGPPASEHWIPGHHTPEGEWIPGHWSRWVPGHYNPDGNWIPGHWAQE